MTKFQVLHQEKDLVLALDDLMILMYLLVRNTGKDLQKQQIVLPVSPNLFQPLFQVLLSHPNDILSSYCLGHYCVKLKLT